MNASFGLLGRLLVVLVLLVACCPCEVVSWKRRGAVAEVSSRKTARQSKVWPGVFCGPLDFSVHPSTAAPLSSGIPVQGRGGGQGWL